MASVKALRSASGGGYQEIGPTDRLAGDASDMLAMPKGATQARPVTDILGSYLLPIDFGVVADARLDAAGNLISGTDQTLKINRLLRYQHDNGIRPGLPRGANGASYLCLGEVGIYDEGDYEGAIYTPAEGARSAPISASGAIVSSDRATVTLANLIPGHRVVLYFNGVAGPATDVGLDGVAVWSVSGGVPVGVTLTYDTAPGYALTIAPDPGDISIVPLDEVQRWAGAVQGASRLRGISPSRKGQCITLDTIDQALLERNGSTFTAVATSNNPATIARAADGYPNGTPVKFRVGANPPAPFVSGTVDAPGPTYYVVARTQLTLKLSATLGGAPITPTAAGTAAYNLEAQDGSANALSVTIAADGIMRATHGAPLNRLITVSADSADPNVTPSLPAPLTAGTYYYAVNVTLDSLQIATSPGGAPISFSSAGAGTLTIYISTGGTRMGDVFVVDDEDGHISPPLIATWDTTTTGRVFTASISQAAPAYFARNGHPLRNGDPFTLETTGELPAPFQRDRFYFVVNAGSAGFNVALSVGGDAIAATTAGSGTHTLTAPLVAWTQGTFKAQTIRNRLSISPPRVVLYGSAVTPRGSVIQLTRCNTELRGIEVKGSSAAQTLVGLNLTGCTGATLHTPAMTDLGVGNTNYAIQVGLSADIDIYSPTGGGGRRSYDGQRAKEVRLHGGTYADAIGGHAQYGLTAIGCHISVSNAANPFCLHFAGREFRFIGCSFSVVHPAQAVFRARTDYMQCGGDLTFIACHAKIDTRGSPLDREFSLIDHLGPARTFDTLMNIEMPSSIRADIDTEVVGEMGSRKVYLWKALKNFGAVNPRDIIGTSQAEFNCPINYEDKSTPATPWTRMLITNPEQLVGKGPTIRVRGVPDLKVDAVPGSAAEATKTTGRAVFDIDIDGPVVMDLRGGSFRRADVRSPIIDYVNRRGGWQGDETAFEWNPALPYASNTSELFRLDGDTDASGNKVSVALPRDKQVAVISAPANAQLDGIKLVLPSSAIAGRRAAFQSDVQISITNAVYVGSGREIVGAPPVTIPVYSLIEFVLSPNRDGTLVWKYLGAVRQKTVETYSRSAALAYTGPNGEVISDGETLRLQDGATPGGSPLMLSTPLTRAVGLTARIPAAVMSFTTLGFATPGDSGGASYARAASGYVTTALDFTSADGAKWQNVSPTVTPQMAGGFADGVNSVHTAMQAVLNTGRPVEIPDAPIGSFYALSATVSFPSGARVRAQGKNAYFKALAGSSANPLLFAVQNAQSNIVVEGLIFDGNRPNITNFNNVMLVFQSKGVVFKRCRYMNTRGIAMIFSGASDCGLEDQCEFLDCGTLNRTTLSSGDRRAAVVFTGVGARGYVRNCRFIGVGLDCISFSTGQTDNEVIDAYIRDCDAAGVYNSGTFRTTISLCDISNGSGGSGIDCPNSSFVTMVGNKCHKNGAGGILVAASCNDVTLSANVCINNWQGKTSEHRGGITFDFAPSSTMSRITLTGNICRDDQGGAATTQRYAIGINDRGGARSDIRIDRSNILTGYAADGTVDDLSKFQSYGFGITASIQTFNLAAGTDYTIAQGNALFDIRLTEINNYRPAHYALRKAGPYEISDPGNGFVGGTAPTGTDTTVVYYDSASDSYKMRNAYSVARAYQVFMV